MFMTSFCNMIVTTEFSVVSTRICGVTNTGDKDTSKYRLSSLNGSEQKEIGGSKAIASPVSQESSATKIVVARLKSHYFNWLDLTVASHAGRIPAL